MKDKAVKREYINIWVCDKCVDTSTDCYLLKLLPNCCKPKNCPYGYKWFKWRAFK